MTDAELTELDLAVARVLGLVDSSIIGGRCYAVPAGVHLPAAEELFQPTRNWSDCGPLVELLWEKRLDQAHRNNPVHQAATFISAMWDVTMQIQQHKCGIKEAVCHAIVASGG